MMRKDTRRYLVAYDIVDDNRRNRAAKVLLSYGDRIQYSVFIIDAIPVKVHRLKVALEQVVDLQVDSVLICDLGLLEEAKTKSVIALGQQRQLTEPDSFII